MKRHVTVMFCLGLLAAGCGDTESRPITAADEKEAALSDVGELYRLYTVEKHKPPTRLADFAPLAPVNPMGLKAVESGAVVVRFGATLTGTQEGTSNDPDDQVLAYEKEVPVSGGRVLMLNRSIRTMTPDEFKAAKLAGTASSEPLSAKGKPRSS